jgi:hypothetical protein
MVMLILVRVAFEQAASQIGDGVVDFSLFLYIDGTSQWRNVSVCPTLQPEIMIKVYRTSLHLKGWRQFFLFMICRQARWPLREGRFGVKWYLLHIVTHYYTLLHILVTRSCYSYYTLVLHILSPNLRHFYTLLCICLWLLTWCLPAVA